MNTSELQEAQARVSKRLKGYRAKESDKPISQRITRTGIDKRKLNRMERKP